MHNKYKNEYVDKKISKLENQSLYYCLRTSRKQIAYLIF